MPAKANNRFVRSAIRAILEPHLTELGFSGKYPEFSRTFGSERHFIRFQTRKYGGGFSFSGAWCSKGPFRHADGLIPPEKVTLAHTDWDNRALAERMAVVGNMDGQLVMRSIGDFAYEYIDQDQELCRALVEEAAEVLPVMDHWLRTREHSAGISCKGHHLRNADSRRFLWHMARAQVGGFDLSAKPPETPFLDRQHEASLAPEYLVAET